MANYLIKRFLTMIVLLICLSAAVFIIIQLPPGDYMTTYIRNLENNGFFVDNDMIEGIRQQFGMDRPPLQRYFFWVINLLRGDMGNSFIYNRPVTGLIMGRLMLTFSVSLITLLASWAIALPLGLYSALRQYSFGDYFFTFISFVALAVPNFLMAILLMYFGFTVFGWQTVGLFSAEFENAPWSIPKLINFLSNLWIPLIVLGVGGAAGTMRILRANMLDELKKQYVITAKAKGLTPFKLIFHYPLRIAINPFISTVGWVLPHLISGATITAIVLNLPLAGPLLLQALQAQDMYLAGSFLMMLSVLTLFGTFISDILLALIDPRIRYGGRDDN
jgi:peptide/nickel transport system permease protein